MAIDSRFVLPPEDIDDLRQSLAKPSKKRKRTRALEADDDAEKDLYDQVLNGPLPSTSKVATASASMDDDAGTDNDTNDELEADEPLNTIPKPLQLDSIESYNAKVDRTGIIYLSRIPPGMGPSKVKHILSHYGETGRIYLVAADAERKGKSSNSADKKHKPHRFVEGWIEFMDKKVARQTAEMLNAKIIGDAAISKTKGNKRNGGASKWRDDVWTMKYLPRFKWNMLSEQVAIEAATRAAHLRNEIAQGKREQADYLRQVERAKNHEKAVDKKKARLNRKVANGDAAPATTTDKAVQAGRSFEQREGVKQKGRTIDEPLSKVLDSIF